MFTLPLPLYLLSTSPHTWLVYAVHCRDVVAENLSTVVAFHKIKDWRKAFKDAVCSFVLARTVISK